MDSPNRGVERLDGHDLVGTSSRGACPDCGMEFAYDADSSIEAGSVTCPNCGRRGLESNSQIAAGDRLLVDRATFGWRRPRRWEVALFRCPEHASDYCVKRVVGLPGETVEIRGGDVYVDGAIARKSLDQQRALAVLVHDTAWSGGQSNLPNRWSSQPDVGWQMDGTGWRSAADSERINWLNYVHWRRVPGAPPTIEVSPVDDDDSYNQTTSRQLNPVSDLMLVGQLSASGEGTLLLKANYGGEAFQIAIESATGVVSLSRGDRVVQTAQAAPGLLDRPTEIVLSLFDRQLLLAIGGRELLSYPIDSLEKPARPTSAPFSIGSRGLSSGNHAAANLARCLLQLVYKGRRRDRDPLGAGRLLRVRRQQPHLARQPPVDRRRATLGIAAHRPPAARLSSRSCPVAEFARIPKPIQCV